MVAPRFSIPRALLALFDRDLAAVVGHPERVGGIPPEDPDPLYVEISRVPGGRWDEVQGYDVVDIDVYSRDFSQADSTAYAVEALLLTGPHSVELDGGVVVLDRAKQNIGPSERPWDDTSVYRVGATYVITARRR